jgi:predicted acyl esterase
MRRYHALAGAVVVLVVMLSASAAAAAAFTAHGSADQVYVTGLASSAKVSLLSARGRTVQTERADSLGGVVFRNVRPGSGYRVRRTGAHAATSAPVSVFTTRSAPPNPSIYDQSIPPSGYGYLTTRDGTKLAIDVHPPQAESRVAPSPPTLPGGISLPGTSSPTPPQTRPVPTLIEYSGYGYADPGGPQNGISVIANLMGFAVVDVNMRGTGCSGGAYDYFEPLQNLDGYDVIETIAHQPWVLHHKVGMMGISYGAISQLFTAQTDPPDLAAISPLSTIDNTQTTLYPGGILNTGFAVTWAKQRVHDALPASAHGGQGWAYQRIEQGDRTCAANQALHGEAVNLLSEVRANSHYTPSVADPLSPVTFVKKIKVPVFLACQFTDEQTGAHCPDLAEHFTGTAAKWFTFTNGTHIDSLDPDTFDRWYDFLKLYVARQAPIINSAQIRAVAPLVYEQAMGINGVTLPPDPIQEEPSYSAALAAFQQLPSVRVLFDNGGGGQSPGEPYPGFEQSWSRLPIPGTTARSWYLAGGGSLAERAPAKPGRNAFTANPHAVPLTDFTGPQDASPGGLWTATPSYRWAQPRAGTALSYITAPLASTTAVVGAGQLHLWLRSSTRNVDLQATITEVRPDGKEEFVQNGWLRADESRLDPRESTQLEPVLSLRASAVRALPRRRLVAVTIPLYYEGHVYRAGSRIRVLISAPNGDQPVWGFAQTSPPGNSHVTIGYGGRMASRLILPVVPGLSVPTGLPPCPGLRGEPCRDYRAIVDRTVSR